MILFTKKGLGKYAGRRICCNRSRIVAGERSPRRAIAATASAPPKDSSHLAPALPLGPRFFVACPVTVDVNAMKRMPMGATCLNMASPPAKRRSLDRHPDTLRHEGLPCRPCDSACDVEYGNPFKAGLRAARPALVEAWC